MNTPFGTMETRDKQWPHKPLGWGKGFTLRFKINRGGGGALIFCDCYDPTSPIYQLFEFHKGIQKSL